MSEYRWITNLRTPYDDLDIALLAKFGNEAKVGDPATGPGILPVAEMKANGIVGLYVTFAGVSKPDIVKQTGWGASLREWNLGPVLPA